MHSWVASSACGNNEVLNYFEKAVPEGLLFSFIWIFRNSFLLKIKFDLIMNKMLALILIFSVQVRIVMSQKWISPQYSYELRKNLIYGKAVDYNGVSRNLLMDLCLPQNDNPPDCGRPLLIAVHGGAFLAGSKEDGLLQTAMKEFAARGYATASINYRLGMFQTSSEVHCNVTQLLNTPWDCLNMSDTAEWYRGWFRAVQDVHRVIRFLISVPQYRIDRRNIFLLGESAGAITVLGAGFLDHPDEYPDQLGNLVSVRAPNRIYEDLCIRQPGFNASIAQMDLSRPDLVADLDSLKNRDYQIRGVAAFYGCSWFDLFARTGAKSFLPALYLFHQTNDLVVPIGTDRILSGTSACFSSLAGCQSIISRPFCMGSDPMEKSYNKSLTDFGLKGYLQYDRKPNPADCLAQVLNPATGGHQVDNIVMRLENVIRFFAPRMADTEGAPCTLSSRDPGAFDTKIYPNPAAEFLMVQNEQGFDRIQILNADGRTLLSERTHSIRQLAQVNISELPPGVYYLVLQKNHSKVHHGKFVVLR